ncbi:MAG: glucose-1-phosphate adenylyltransferase [bacterium]
MDLRKILTFILAGGVGKRLYPLTKDRAKPAVPFGGIYRIIDITLSNCINSNLRRIYILPQYKYESLDRHIRMGWNILSPELGEFIISIPPQKRIDENWYRGTADAIYQNLYTLEDRKPELVLVLSGDHIYKMNYEKMIRYHIESRADITVGTIEVEKDQASQLGIIQIDSHNKIIGFQEKPKDPQTLPQKSTHCFANMGVYVFSADVLHDVIQEDAWKDTEHDFGKNVIPMSIAAKNVMAYNFIDENKKDAKYWRDIGTLDAYWEANMDLVSVTPLFNLYDEDWPIRTHHIQAPPAKTVFAERDLSSVHGEPRCGSAIDSLISHGCILSGGKVQNCVLSPNVTIHSYSFVYKSVLMEGVHVGRFSRIQNAIIDKGVIIPPRTTIGYDLAEDSKKYTVTDSGIVVVPKKMTLDTTTS